MSSQLTCADCDQYSSDSRMGVLAGGDSKTVDTMALTPCLPHDDTTMTYLVIPPASKGDSRAGGRESETVQCEMGDEASGAAIMLAPRMQRGKGKMQRSSPVKPDHSACLQPRQARTPRSFGIVRTSCEGDVLQSPSITKPNRRLTGLTTGSSWSREARCLTAPSVTMEHTGGACRNPLRVSQNCLQVFS